MGKPLLRIGGQRCFASKRRVWKRTFMVGSMHRRVGDGEYEPCSCCRRGGLVSSGGAEGIVPLGRGVMGWGDPTFRSSPPLGFRRAPRCGEFWELVTGDWELPLGPAS